MTQREAIGYMLGADLLLVEEIGPVMPSKALQYLRAGRPILALVDGGGESLRDTLQSVARAHLVRRNDVTAVAAVIARVASAPRRPPDDPGDLEAYSRRGIARRFAEVLDAVCQRSEARVVDRDGVPRPALPLLTRP